jgi:hypothetical protein
MTTPDINQYHRALSAEIKRRGLDCWLYGNVAEEQRKAEAALRGALNRAGGGGVQAPQTRAVPPPKGFTNCVISGNVISCSGPRGMVRCVDQGAGVLRCN